MADNGGERTPRVVYGRSLVVFSREKRRHRLVPFILPGWPGVRSNLIDSTSKGLISPETINRARESEGERLSVQLYHPVSRSLFVL